MGGVCCVMKEVEKSLPPRMHSQLHSLDIRHAMVNHLWSPVLAGRTCCGV